MAWTAHKTDDELQEHFADEETLQKQAKEVAQLMRESAHTMFFTGAGISTSAGIPDFRGPQGVWTMRAQGKEAVARTSTIRATPTATHMAIVALVDRRLAHFVVSQNTDGLHRRSGVDKGSLAELHGNSNLEYCKACGKQYLRDYGCSARNRTDIHDHRTGRTCACGAPLHDSIIHFGEALPKKALGDAFEHARRATLCVALGSSLTVTPACDVPRRVAQAANGKLVVCNLQKTPLDGLADVRVFAPADALMQRVLAELGVAIEPWVLTRRAKFTATECDGDRREVLVESVEADGAPASVFRHIEISNSAERWGRSMSANADSTRFASGPVSGLAGLAFKLSFMGHYGEPELKLELPKEVSEGTARATHVTLRFHSGTAQWLEPKWQAVLSSDV